MDKKKAKKGKGKGKGKKDKKKGKKEGELTKREQEIYLSTIASLEHKIEWRKHLCSIMREETKKLQEKFQAQRRDKIQSVTLLENAIAEHREMSKNLQRMIPEAKYSAIQAIENTARERTSKLKQMNQDNMSYDIQLETLKKKVESLEIYSPEEVDDRIKDIEQQLASEDTEDVISKAIEQDKRREEAFRKEMQGILRDEANSFQAELSKKNNSNFERITEENRWWADTANSLRLETDQLKADNEMKSENLRAAQKHMKQRKEVAVEASYRLQEKESTIKFILCKIKEMENERKANAELLGHLQHLNKISVDLEQSLISDKEILKESVTRMNETEEEIKALEEKLSCEVLFGEQLTGFIERAKKLLAEAVKYSLILTYDGPPKKKKVLEELRSLFIEATEFIYERENKSVL